MCFNGVLSQVIAKNRIQNSPRIFDINQKMFSPLGLSYIGINIQANILIHGRADFPYD